MDAPTDDRCRQPQRPAFWWLSRLLFAAQRRLNVHVDPLSWDNGTTAVPTDQCTFVQLVIVLLTIAYETGRQAVGLLAVAQVLAAALQVKQFAFGHLVRIYGGPEPDRWYATCVFAAQCAAISVVTCALAAVYVPIVRAAWLLWTAVDPFH